MLRWYETIFFQQLYFFILRYLDRQLFYIILGLVNVDDYEQCILLCQHHLSSSNCYLLFHYRFLLGMFCVTCINYFAFSFVHKLSNNFNKISSFQWTVWLVFFLHMRKDNIFVILKHYISTFILYLWHVLEIFRYLQL